ncbi:MAG: RNA polymerase sporulation sigma factor SigK [Lachnospiraceae bacterium]|nr:RNA polymerase sporulation sigma factor SigK [Lachnospiraceae bacterium]
MLFLQSFQKPVTREEEKEFRARMKAGDKEARDILIERNLRLVAHIVKKYTSYERDIEDLITIGTIGLIKAIDTYDDEKGSRLVTYAAKCIDNELLMMLRQEKKNAKDVSLYEPIGTDKEGNEINLLDIIESQNENLIEKIDQVEKIRRLQENINIILTKREQDIIKKRYGVCGSKKYTQKEIADKMGISRSYVSRIEKKALKKLRTIYE